MRLLLFLTLAATAFGQVELTPPPATGSGLGDALVANPLTQFTGILPTNTEFNYVDGVTSAIQAQLNLKAPLASPTFTTSVTTGSTTFALLNATATTINMFGAATTVNTGASAAQVWNFGGHTTASEFRFLEPSGSGTNYSGFKAAAQAASINYTLPTTVAAAGEVLTDVAGDGVLSWETAGAGSFDIDALSAATEADIATTDVFAVSDAGTEKKITLENMVDLLEAQAWTFSSMDVTTLDATNFEIGNVAVTSSAAELNILDGATLAVAELNYVDGVTSAIQTQLDAKSPLALVTKNTAASYTVGTTNANEFYGGVIYVTGAATITIPAVAAGASFTVITIGAVAVSVDPNAADLIYLNGTALADGDKITNASTTGDMAVFTYYDGTGWVAMTNTGWTDGN